jgi:uncharacterized protein (TIGR02268 family)
VSLSPCCGLVLWVLVLPPTARAQPLGLKGAPATRQLELSQLPQPELWVAPGQTTLVLLDAPLDIQRMRQAEPPEGLRRMEVTENSVTLVMAEGLEDGARRELTLWFADGRPAEGVTLVLTVDHAKAEPEVELYRGRPPAEALERRVEGLNAQVAALNARIAALSERQVSLFPLIAAGVLGPQGVRSMTISAIFKLGAPGLSTGDGWLHVAAGRIGLELTLTVAPGAPAWVPGAVTLHENGSSEPLPVRGMELLSGAALQPGTSTRLLVEWDTPQPADGMEYVLKVEERNGPRWLQIKRLRAGSTPTQPPSGKKEQTP